MITDFIRYQRTIRNLTESTLWEYAKDLHAFVAWTRKASTPLTWSIITPSIIELYISQQREAGLKATTINRRTSTLYNFFAYLQKRHGLTANPVAAVDRMRMPKTMPKPAPKTTISNYLADASEDAQLQALTALMTATGIRISEALQLTWGDIDKERSGLKIHGKGRKERMVYYGNDARATLNAYAKHRTQRQPSERIFTYDYHEVYNRMRDGMRDNGRGITPHQLRHRFATDQLDKGTDILTLSAMLGHEMTATTQRYTQVTDSRQRAAFLQ